jgi:hypothetical protein
LFSCSIQNSTRRKGGEKIPKFGLEADISARPKNTEKALIEERR